VVYGVVYGVVHAVIHGALQSQTAEIPLISVALALTPVNDSRCDAKALRFC
jgi:hypothetical protein